MSVRYSKTELSYTDAVAMLLGIKSLVIPSYEPKPKKPFKLPKANSDMRRAYAYLMQKRFIDREVISHFAHNKTIYEDAEYHNIIFVGFNENGIPKHAQKKSTYSDDRYRGNVESSQPEYSFHYIGTSDLIYIFEAPIDMLSFIMLNKNNWEQHSYVALCSVTEHAAVHQLKQNSHLQKIVLCLDYDKAGIEASHRIMNSLRQLGYSDIEILEPNCKDWNEDLKQQNGETAIQAVEHIGIQNMRELCSDVILSSRYEKLTFNDIGKMVDNFEKMEHSANNKDFIAEKSYDMALVAFLIVKESYRQLQIPITDEQLGDRLFSFYLPHRDSSSLKNKLNDIADNLCTIQKQQSTFGVTSKTEELKQTDDILRLCINCLRVYSAVSQTQTNTMTISM